MSSQLVGRVASATEAVTVPDILDSAVLLWVWSLKFDFPRAFCTRCECWKNFVLCRSDSIRFWFAANAPKALDELCEGGALVFFWLLLLKLYYYYQKPSHFDMGEISCCCRCMGEGETNPPAMCWCGVITFHLH